MWRYEHGGDVYGNKGVLLDFSVNTNPMGMPERVREALIDGVDGFSRYPDPRCRELCAAIARLEGVPEDWVLCGNGAADLIYRLCWAVKPRRALLLAPTFSEYRRALEAVGCRVLCHTLTPDNGFELTAELERQLILGVDMLFLCNPNNPTGRLIPDGTLDKALQRAMQNRTLVVMDECFLDFTRGASVTGRLQKMPNLVVLKAFTKLYAMAGLRLGYALSASGGLLNGMERAAQCWSVSVPAQIAGAAALEVRGWREKTRRLIDNERGFLAGGLRGLGIEVFPSDANFLLLRSDFKLRDLLLPKGIMIRACENFDSLDASYYRVCVKTRPDNRRLLMAAEEALHG